MVLSILLVAQSSSGDVTGTLVQYGAIGAMLVVLGFFAKSLIKREQDRADNLEKDNKRLNELVQDKIVPALINATTAVNSSQQILQDIQKQKEIDEKLAERERRGRLE